MRYAVILAGGSGTRLWPMSRTEKPKQLIPLVEGRSLLELAHDRLVGLVPEERCLVCAGRSHADEIRRVLPQLGEERFLGEPCGRDTLAAIGLCAAVPTQTDADAVVAVFTADHVIEPIDRFQAIVNLGYELVERRPEALVTFGITPTGPATGYGYLELGDPLGETARRLKRFREKPKPEPAEEYYRAGPERFLWNSGMLVYRAETLLEAIRRHAPDDHQRLMQIAKAWHTPRRDEVLDSVYPTMTKTSIEYAVFEPASLDPAVTFAAIPMPVDWLDVGSWNSLGMICRRDGDGNVFAAPRAEFMDSRNTLAASSDSNHLIAAIGCDDLVIVHTPDATLVCRADKVEAIKELHRLIAERWGGEYV